MFINRYREEYPDRKVEMILFDVLGPPHPEMDTDLIPKIAPSSLYEIYIGVGYRFIFALMHLTQRYMHEKLAKVIFIPLILSMKILRLSPTYKIDAKVFQNRKTPLDRLRMMYMAYPYVNMPKAMFTGKSQKVFQDFSLPKDLEKTPVLYMYGTEKRIMFHDHRSVQILKSSKGKSNAIGVDNAGHWLQTEGQKMEYCLEKVKEFLDTV
jgi:pimeloyl-ACP methyl ester carboxylesterase